MRDYFNGSIFLARRTIESDIFFKKPDKWFKIWIFILLIANYKDNKQFKRGECFTNYNEICHYTKATQNTVDHCIRWLKQAKQIATRKATRGFYIIVLNYDKYQLNPACKSDTKSDSRSELKAKQKRHRGDTINKKEKNDKNNNNTKATAVAEYNFENKLNELLKEKRRDLHIIGLYWQYKDFHFENENQFQAGLRRELRPAKDLVGYSDDELCYVMDWLIDKTDINWKLETIHKFINEDLDNIKWKKNK